MLFLDVFGQIVAILLDVEVDGLTVETNFPISTGDEFDPAPRFLLLNSYFRSLTLGLLWKLQPCDAFVCRSSYKAKDKDYLGEEPMIIRSLNTSLSMSPSNRFHFSQLQWLSLDG